MSASSLWCTMQLDDAVLKTLTMSVPTTTPQGPLARFTRSYPFQTAWTIASYWRWVLSDVSILITLGDLISISPITKFSDYHKDFSLLTTPFLLRNHFHCEELLWGNGFAFIVSYEITNGYSHENWARRCYQVPNLITGRSN